MKILILIRECYNYLYDKKLRFWVSCGLKVITIIISLIPAYLISKIIGQLANIIYTKIILYIGALVVAYFFLAIIELISFKCKQNIKKVTKIRIKKDFLENVFTSYKYITKNESSKITEILYSDVNSIIELIFIFVDIIMYLIIIIFTGYLLASINGLFTIILSLFIITSTIISLFISRKLRCKNLELREDTDIHFKLIRDIIKNIRAICMSNSIDFHLNKYNKNLDCVKEKTIKRDTMSWAVVFIGNIFGYLWIIVYFFLGIKDVSNALMSITTFILFFSYSKIFSSSCYSLLSSNANIQQTIISVERAFNILLFKKEINSDSNMYLFPEKISSIKINNLNYSYNETIVFNNINAEISNRNCIIISGKNGAGKTTLLNLLAGILSAKEDKIYFNNIPVNNIKYESISKEITYFSQDDVLFDMTIKENILSFKGGDRITDQELFNACSSLKILDEIIALNEGFNTLLSEIKNFSFGQRKKILFIRALLKPSQIILFDEPLAGLDYNSQLIIIDIIKNLRTDKIIFISTHRPELFNFCDKIITL